MFFFYSKTFSHRIFNSFVFPSCLASNYLQLAPIIWGNFILKPFPSAVQLASWPDELRWCRSFAWAQQLHRSQPSVRGKWPPTRCSISEHLCVLCPKDGIIHCSCRRIASDFVVGHYRAAPLRSAYLALSGLAHSVNDARFNPDSSNSLFKHSSRAQKLSACSKFQNRCSVFTSDRVSSDVALLFLFGDIDLLHGILQSVFFSPLPYVTDKESSF